MSSEILPLIDFSKVKKKKVEKPIETAVAENNEDEGDDLKDIVLSKPKNKKEKKKKDKAKEGNTAKANEEEKKENDAFKNINGYSYEFLLERIYKLIRQVHPDISSDKTSIRFPKPQINAVGKNKGCWMNFGDFAKILNRPIDHLFKFILGELGVEGTIGADNQANLKAKVTQSTQTTIEKTLSKYVNDYVRCPNCKSVKTIIKKDQSTRLPQIYCENCKTEKTIQVLKSRVKAGKK